MSQVVAAPQPASRVRAVPRIAFVGLGWIGRNRLEAMAGSGMIEVQAVSDSSAEAVAATRELLPNVERFSRIEELQPGMVDGVVIATPNSYHAEQAIAAFERGLAVFCQKPLGRAAGETERIIDAARQANRLLAIDLSYRFIPGARSIRELVRSGALGDVFGIDLTFHNAYGPNKRWFYDRAFSGGGCVLDLGIHLVDLALWSMSFPAVTNITSRTFFRGRSITDAYQTVEDFAIAEFAVGEAATRLTCSWDLHAGQPAIIEAVFYGTRAAAALKNVNGSFFDFTAELYTKTSTTTLDDESNSGWIWGPSAALDWCERLALDNSFDASVEEIVHTASVIDEIYNSARKDKNS